MKDDSVMQRNHSLEDHAAVEAICGGIPVYSFNNLVYVYGQSPDFYPSAMAQAENRNPIRKLKLKKTWEIKNNFSGICHEMTPRTRQNDSQPFLPVHLIDGDPGTIWASFECLAYDANEEWIRIDLPIESLISSVKLTCLKRYMDKDKPHNYREHWQFGNSLPKQMSVKVSKDAWHWDTAFECEDLSASGICIGDSKDPDGAEVKFEKPVTAKQIWVSGKGFSKIGYEGYMFSVSGVEVTAPDGRNLALISNGAGVTVSSTSDAHNTDRYSANSLWGPLQYDLGNKWVKVGSDNGSLLWCFVEHEKDILAVDADADAAITEVTENGINVLMTLDFKGNWIYENPPRKTDWAEARFRELNDYYLCGCSLADSNSEMFDGYLRFVEYMVKHFKDRVQYFEIGNEWHGWHDNLNWYKNAIFEPVYDKIKETAPDAKIALCGTPGFITEDILSCLGPGAVVLNSKLTLPGRVLLSVKGVNTGDMIVSADSDCASPSGIVLRFKSRDSFLAAMYDPAAERIFFIECIGNHGWTGGWNNFGERDVIALYPHKSVVGTGNMGTSVHMEAKSVGDTVSFSVSSGKRTVESKCTVENAETEGSAGFLHYPDARTGELSNFRIASLLNDVIFADDFDRNDHLGNNWEIVWSHWGDPNKRPAAERLDGVCWHTAELPTNDYFNRVRKFRKDCEHLGYKGNYFANEIYAGSAYPPGPQEGNPYRLSDMQEAKYLINSMVGYAGLNIESGPCHINFGGFPHPQSTCRTTVPSQVVAPNQPKPSHYCIRNICTALDDFYEAEFTAEFPGDDSNIVSFTMESGDKTEIIIAAFLEVDFTDQAMQKKTSITIHGIKVESVLGIDTFNGTEQELNFTCDDDGTLLEDVVIKDYPLLVKLKKL